MKHPLSFEPEAARKPLFIVAITLTLIVFTLFQPLDIPLRTASASSGIVSFELARTPANVQAMIASWDERARQFAAFGLGFDFLFMPLYAIAISLGCLLAAGRHPGMFAKVGTWLGWGAFLAMVLDMVENIGLWNSLLGNAQTVWPAISFWCAIFKFGLIILGILYGLTGWIWPKTKKLN